MSEQPQPEPQRQTKTTSQAPQEHQERITTEEIEEMDINTASKCIVYNKVCDITQRFATTRIGQFVLSRADRALKMLENTARWSLPQDQSDLKLERPLPWIPFIMLIMTLRVARLWVSLIAVLIGNSPVTPQDAVYFIQTRRRKLRATRVSGLKTIHDRELEEIALKSGTADVGVIYQLRKLLAGAICRPGEHDESARCIFIPRNKLQVTKNIGSIGQAAKRPRDDDDLNFNEMLSKYAAENSEDDSDFIPNQEEEESNDPGSSSSSNSSVSDEAEGQNISKEKSSKQVSQKTESDPMDNSVEIKENGGQERAMPKPLIAVKNEPTSSDIDSGNEQVLTPRENGPEKNTNEANREEEVAPRENSTPTPTYRLPLPNGNETQQKSTPGHESAAMVKPKVLPAFGATATAAPSIKATDSFSVSPNSNNCSSSSSYASLASLVTNEDIILNTSSEPPTPTTTPTNFESSALITASSSEDLFYSPIGSPSDFNTYFKPVSILKKPASQSNQIHTPIPTKAVNEASGTETVSPPDSEKAYIQQQQQQQQQNQQSQKQHQYQNRYRGRNRR